MNTSLSSSSPHQSPEQDNPFLHQIVEYGGDQMRVTSVKGRAATLQQIDPRTGKLMKGSIYGTYIPLDELERLLNKSEVQEIRGRIQSTFNSNQFERLRLGQKIPYVVLKTEGKDLVKEVYADSINENRVHLAGQGSVGTETLLRYIQLGEKLSEKYKRTFKLRSGSDSRIIYDQCKILGINIDGGGIVVGFTRSDGRLAHKEFENEEAMWKAMV